MELNDELDIEKLVQYELDAISLDDTIEDTVDDDAEINTNVIEDESNVSETRRNLEREMHERLAAFENEVKANLDRYDIDYSEIDELLKKPVGNYEDEIQKNVARQCGMEPEELERILQSINTEEMPLDSSIESDSTDYDDPKIKILRQSLSMNATNKSVELTARQEEQQMEKEQEQEKKEEDPNKKLYDERLAESNRRMFDELALLEQKRKEEEERYAIVLQEQQARLAEEYRRLQERLDENVRQTNNERLQFETLCREQERVTLDRQHKMATLIQAWYRGRRIYHQYHGEILKRVAPALRAIAKKRKKKEQEELANAAKLAKIQEEKKVDKENEEKIDNNSILLPINNRISSPLPETNNKKPKQLQKVPPVTETKETVPPQENVTKKKKVQPKSQNVPKQTLSSSILPTAQVMQLESPYDFIPAVIPEQRSVLSPRKIQVENKNLTTKPQPVPSSIQITEQRPKSFNKRQNSARSERPETPVIKNELPTNNENISIIEPINKVPVESNVSLPSMIRSNTFERKPESPRPSIEIIPTPSKSISRSDTFHKETEPSFPAPFIQSVDTKNSISVDRSNAFIDQLKKPPSPPVGTISPIDYQQRPLDSFLNTSENLSSFNEHIPVDLSSDLKLPEEISVKPDLLITPRISTPRQTTKREEHHLTKIPYTFLNEARRWAGQTRDMTYANLILSTEESTHQLPIRKTAANIRKLPDVDSHILTKAAKKQSPKELRYLILEQILSPCSLSLIGTTYPNLTHLILRQCKLVQLVGIESCTLLTVLDIEGNWLEQVHIQLNHLEYLNMSRNRITSLLSLNTPCLKYLDVSKNRLTRLNGVEALKKLNVLLATSNQLLTTIGLQGCTNLIYIDVSDNHLVEMEQIDQCPLLITIKASSNALIQIPNLLNAILLNELDLSSNSLTSFDESSFGSWLPFLTHFRLSNNSLQELLPVKLPSLVELDLGFNQISDVLMLKRFIKDCSLLCRLNLAKNPVLCDLKDSSLIEEKSPPNPLPILPQSLSEKSSQAIQLYLTFLSNLNSMFIKLRQTVEQHQTEPFHLLKSIHNQCQQYYEQKIIEPIEIDESILPVNNNNDTKKLSAEEQSIVRLQAHWRRRLVERLLSRKWYAAQKIQTRWRGYAVRQRIRYARRLFSQQQHQIFDEIDLAQFDFDEAAFEARFQRPSTPPVRIRQVWQPHTEVLAKTNTLTELPRPNSSRSSSAASSRAKPVIEPIPIQNRTHFITDEWGLAPTSSTAALMLKRAEKMKWNSERKHKREHMDAFQRLKVARQNELPPGSLRLARRPAPLANTTKAIAHAQTLSPPATSQPRSNRVFEWVHTQVARFEDSSLGSMSSPRNERKRLPSLDGSTDSMSRLRSNEALQQQQQQQRWSSSTVSVRQPPSLLPPINGHLPRV